MRPDYMADAANVGENERASAGGHGLFVSRLCRIIVFGVFLSAVARFGHVAASPRPAADAVTFARDVAPILFAHCANCHRDGGSAAALPLVNYSAVRHEAKAIRASVLARAMPPWPADPQRSVKFRNDARLEAREIDTIAAWVDAGAPLGDPRDLPPLPPSPPRWLHPRGVPPDAVLRLPEVLVSATGEVPYLQQRVKVPLSEDRWISAMQVAPGNDVLVHHMGITEVRLDTGLNADDLDALAKVARQMGLADDALTHPRPAVLDALNPEAYDMLGVYTPGSSFEMYDDDSGKLLKAGKDLYVNFNIHYTTTGRPEKNHSELALWFSPRRPAHQLIRAPLGVSTLIANGRELLTDDPGSKAEGTEVAIPPIPPFADNYELTGVTGFIAPVTLYQLQPHAHMRGKNFTYSVVYPDGRELTVLTVPQYDFHWQLAYQLAEPLHLPAGSKLVVTAHYDNSVRNKHLRGRGVDPQCGPDRHAYFRRQNQSWHEMFSPLVQYSVDGPTAAPSDDRASRLIETIGCVTPASGSHWTLVAASEPASALLQSTSALALHAANPAPGPGAYELLGAEIFRPRQFRDSRVAVKGLLIRDSAGARINVTSLQPVAGACL